MCPSLYIWDTAQYPALAAGTDSSLSVAKADFDVLRTTPIATSSLNSGVGLALDCRGVEHELFRCLY